MKSSKVYAAMAMALLLTVCLTAAPLQQAPAPGQTPPAGQRGPGAGQPPAAQPPAGGQAAQDKTATGQLAKVDAKEMEITIKGADNKEMVFTYNAATQITGVDGPQGLAGKTGSTLRVTYRESGGDNLATRIEVQGAQPQQK